MTGKKRILIIDDEPNVRKTLCDILKMSGYEALAAGDGAGGLAMMRDLPIDLAIVDLGLPDISGLEVLEGTKRICPSAEVIVLTGSTSSESAVETVKKGAFFHLQKPCDLEQLLLLIKKALARHQGQAGSGNNGREVPCH